MNTAAATTPGPWNIVENTPSLVETENRDRFIQVTEIVPGLPTHEMRVEEMWANARLCASAPDLLAALKEANAFILAPAEDIKDGVLSRLRAAIVKAS